VTAKIEDRGSNREEGFPFFSLTASCTSLRGSARLDLPKTSSDLPWVHALRALHKQISISCGFSVLKRS